MICFRIVARVGCTRCLVTGIPDEWSPPPLGVSTEPGLQTVWPISKINTGSRNFVEKTRDFLIFEAKWRNKTIIAPVSAGFWR